MLPELLIVVAALVGNFIVGLFTYIKNPKSATGRYFLLFSVVIALYNLINFFALHQGADSDTLFWIRSVIVSAWLLNLTFYFLARSFPYTHSIASKLETAILTIVTFALIPLTYSSLIFTGVKTGTTQPQPGPGIALLLIHTLGLLGGGSFFLIKRALKSQGRERTQTRLLVLGAIAMFFMILLTNLFIVLVFKTTAFVGLLPIYTLGFVIVISYAIVRHRFLDIGLIVGRSVAYLLVLLILSVGYSIILLFFGSRVLGIQFTLVQYVFYGILILVGSFIFQPIRRRLESFTDRVFFKGYYDSQELLRIISSTLASNIELKDLTQGVLQKLVSTMRIARAAFVLLKSKDHGQIEYVEGTGYKDAPDFSNEAVAKLLTRKHMIISDDLEEGELKEAMRKLDITAALPLTVNEEKVGLLCLGEKSSGEIYSEQDIKVLEILEPELSVAVQNSREYEEIKQFNVTLKVEIENATKELVDANEKLKQLDKLKDEFVSLASHELRTPMTVIKSYLWMVLQGKVEKGSDKEKDYLGRVYKSTEDLISLVNSMLNVSRIEAGKIIIVTKPDNIVNWAKEFAEDLIPRSQETGISVEVAQPLQKISDVMVDPAKIREVFTNIVGNSFKFTPKGGKIVISFEEKDGMCNIHIKDNGKGIDKEDQPKLFQKFGQTGKDVLTRPLAQGTGLGLYITKAIVELHGGKIWAESEGEGKGTTFSFSLKIATPEEIEKAKQQPKENQDIAPSATLQPASV